MKILNIFSILGGFRIAIQYGLCPTLRALLQSPMLLFHPRTLSQIFFAHVWVVWGDGSDSVIREVKESLLSPNAHGVVIDIGAGYGHSACYLSPSRVSKYVALEPNVLMHPKLRAAATSAGFSEENGTLVILSYGVEHVDKIISSLGGQNCVDTIISILTLCSIPEPQRTLQLLVHHVLRPKGQFIFYEHVASPRPDVRFWQRFWAPLWKVFFNGCSFDRPTDHYIRELKDIWEPFTDEHDSTERTGIWKDEGNDEETLWWHEMGRLIKRAE